MIEMAKKLVIGLVDDDGNPIDPMYVDTTPEEDAQAAIDAKAASDVQVTVDAEISRKTALIGDNTLKAFIQTIKGFKTPADVQAYWTGLTAAQKTNVIFTLILYIASKE